MRWQCDAAIPDADESDIHPVIACGNELVAKATKGEQTPSGSVTSALLDFSSDGVHWTQVANPGEPRHALYCANDQVWTVADHHGSQVLAVASPSGTSRTSPRLANESWIYAITGDGHRLFVYGTTNYVSDNDGLSFRRFNSNLGEFGGLTSVLVSPPRYSHGMYLAVAATGLVESRDGMHWQRVK